MCGREHTEDLTGRIRASASSIKVFYKGVEIGGYHDGGFVSADREQDAQSAPAASPFKVTFTALSKLDGILVENINQAIASGRAQLVPVKVTTSSGRTWTFDAAQLVFRGSRWAKRQVRKVRMARKKRRGWA